MKDNPEFNIRFVSIVGEYPCLYDINCSEYNNRAVQDRSWTKIANEVSESVNECKERWKNLRGCYTRYLRSVKMSGCHVKKYKRPYYLTDYLSYLEPFTKVGSMKGNIQEAEPCTLTEQEEETIVTQPEEETQSLSPLPSHPVSNNNKKRLKLNSNREEILQSAYEYFQRKKESILKSSKKVHNSDLSFLVSVLPDMEAMNSDQKRRFKIEILTLAGKILNESKTSSEQSSQLCASTSTHSA